MEKNRAFSLVNQNQSTYVVDTKHDTKEMHLAFLWALRYLMEDNQHNTNNPFFEKVVNVVGWMKRRGSFGDLSRCASRAFDAYYSYEHGDYKYDWDEG